MSKKKWAKRSFLTFEGGPWDGAHIEAPKEPWNPPLKLWVFITTSQPNNWPHWAHHVSPHFWELKMYPAPTAYGPYVAKDVDDKRDYRTFGFRYKPSEAG